MVDDIVIRTEKLSRTFGKTDAVHAIDLHVRSGCVFALAGENGAGKTTLIRMLLGLLKPSGGRVEVFGMNPLRKMVAVGRRTGYVPEQHHMPDWMTLRELLRFIAPFYPTWDKAHARELLDRFNLDEKAKIKTLSRGGVARVALTLALAHRPELLVLDEPTSGLDAVVRRDFLQSIVRLIANEGRTVLISSHLLADVERVADRVAFLRKGRLGPVEDLDALKQRFRRVRMTFPGEPPQDFDVPGVLRTVREDHRLELIFDRFDDAVLDRLRADAPGADITTHGLSLEEIFIELAAEQGQPALAPA